ncbi:uncharacterized protein MYCFIDRAFT_178747 [Pseudocercospora fijiensis CIRAD86]|uniref:Uncharacterized protein n=1 Tax=Pseudocercospora fijiensis (strain CIRAD86) TaxID=383855 RepID=M2ZHN7_PSEFD|nr:uncharacterized protein MYCFIDRAFT_178747 [Pseudocercospora fijiensis CIRAD86]EME78634.1 hypothetical protein MYCFIDRAFT_178747 [Pseudocercospora fijiensis CIRAD86]
MATSFHRGSVGSAYHSSSNSPESFVHTSWLPNTLNPDVVTVLLFDDATNPAASNAPGEESRGREALPCWHPRRQPGLDWYLIRAGGMNTVSSTAMDSSDCGSRMASSDGHSNCEEPSASYTSKSDQAETKDSVEDAFAQRYHWRKFKIYIPNHQPPHNTIALFSRPPAVSNSSLPSRPTSISRIPLFQNFSLASRISSPAVVSGPHLTSTECLGIRPKKGSLATVTHIFCQLSASFGARRFSVILIAKAAPELGRKGLVWQKQGRDEGFAAVQSLARIWKKAQVSLQLDRALDSAFCKQDHLEQFCRVDDFVTVLVALGKCMLVLTIGGGKALDQIDFSTYDRTWTLLDRLVSLNSHAWLLQFARKTISAQVVAVNQEVSRHCTCSNTLLTSLTHMLLGRIHYHMPQGQSLCVDWPIASFTAAIGKHITWFCFLGKMNA